MIKTVGQPVSYILTWFIGCFLKENHPFSKKNMPTFVDWKRHSTSLATSFGFAIALNFLFLLAFVIHCLWL